jgi:hypothetical protein
MDDVGYGGRIWQSDILTDRWLIFDQLIYLDDHDKASKHILSYIDRYSDEQTDLISVRSDEQNLKWRIGHLMYRNRMVPALIYTQYTFSKNSRGVGKTVVKPFEESVPELSWDFELPPNMMILELSRTGNYFIYAEAPDFSSKKSEDEIEIIYLYSGDTGQTSILPDSGYFSFFEWHYFDKALSYFSQRRGFSKPLHIYDPVNQRIIKTIDDVAFSPYWEPNYTNRSDEPCDRLCYSAWDKENNRYMLNIYSLKTDDYTYIADNIYPIAWTKFRRIVCKGAKKENNKTFYYLPGRDYNQLIKITDFNK